ncbi:DUF86 domain-containing protein [Candidatus Pacearchaeota archaeon CG_4_9_14_0_2_um_filter_39_13]|nr:DUF86 domain-containing protein [Candidatus Pacearchaeota archaeon]OIO42961.1 MAG: hypothetical protein AUJ64_03250 [Candidatus Pacearchaeota archaeon CG1_02_39_14]PJC44974.1 MAG: DUF86 domain-containing protein [Candidatus Pacearchaeota archaeon CG_4_9_14_0_2_um_filter_39_13]
MKRDYKLYIQDIFESIEYIEAYTAKLSQEEFNKDIKVQDAVIRRLEIIGEASRNIPGALKEKNKQVPWFEISRFRNFISHSYFEIGKLTIWKTIKERIPMIKEGLLKIKLV